MREAAFVGIFQIQPPTTVLVDVVPTPLMAVKNCRSFSDLLFAFYNPGAFPVTVTVQTGEFNGIWDTEVVPTYTVAPGEQRSFAVTGNLRTFYRVQAVAAGGQSNVQIVVRGAPRSSSVV